MKEWITEIPIRNSHLEKVFQADLVEGMIYSMRDHITRDDVLPFMAFEQKPKTIFGFHKSVDSILETPKWEMLDFDEMKKIWRLFAYRFLQKFLIWQEENQEMIQSSEEWKETHMLYLQKIMGENNCENHRSRKLQEWLYSYIYKKFVEVEII
jgi:hypothetical protein